MSTSQRGRDLVSAKGTGIVMKEKRMASPAQCRAARALLGWTQAELAERSRVARKTIADFELAQRTLHYRTRRDITLALEEAGVEFTWGDELDGASRGKVGEGLRFVTRKLTK